MKKFKIMFLGTGNAMVNDKGNYHSNAIISYGKDRLFIDCGSDFPHALEDAGIRHRKVKNLYISHIHADHAGGLEWLGFINHFDRGAKKIGLYCVGEVKRNLNKMLTPAMKTSIKNMGSEGIAACFNLKPLVNTKSFAIGEMKCTVIKTLHVSEFEKLYSYGLFITGGNTSILFTSDTQFNPELFMPYYKKADLILHDCSTGLQKYAAHAHISELATLPIFIKRKMYLYHYGFGEKPDAIVLDFKGYAQQREIITI